jgi:hypothetical protein
MIVRALSGLLLVVLAIGAAALERNSASAQSGVDLAPAEQFDRFRLYYLGDSFEDLPLTDIDRDRVSRHAVWNFIYGDCEPPPGQTSCAFPLVVQNSTICDRFPAVFYVIPKTFPFRGARVARPPTAGSVDIYTGRTTVSIFGDAEDQEGAAHALREVGSTTVPPRLRSPPKGSMKGKLPCQQRWKRFVDGPHADHAPF